MEEEFKMKNRYEGLQLHSDVPIADLAKCKDGANILHKKHLNEELIEYMTIFNKIPSHIKHKKVAILEFHDDINNVIVSIDPNDIKFYNYQIVKKICDDKGIYFANQSFPSVVKKMRTNFMTIERAKFSN